MTERVVTDQQPSTSPAARAGAAGRAVHLAPGHLGMVRLQQRAGNRAVSSLVAQRLAMPTVQRDDPPSAPSPAPAPARADVDAVTFRGFDAWAESFIAEADEVCVDAEGTANALPAETQGRLQRLIAAVVDGRNAVDHGKDALAAGAPYPRLTTDTLGFVRRVETDLQTLRDVTQAWQSVQQSAIFALLASIGRAQVAEANRLRDRLVVLQRRLRELQRIASGREMNQAFAQAGINLGITGAVLLVGAIASGPAAPIVIIAGIAGTAAQLTVDQLLGISGPDALTFTAAGTSVSGTGVAAASARWTRQAEGLRTWGGRLGNAGAIFGTFLDAREAYQSVGRYEAARAELVALGQELQQVSTAMRRLEPVLAFPAQAQRMISVLSGQAAILREHGQLTLAQHGQL